ncbi:MAG: TatD family hydrolase [Alphaproteobacteria bacterium]|nr:TatD family hydrolase [Alphaproteobacteria bacterium]
MYFDTHLHLINENEIIKAHKKNINGFIINATTENEWEAITTLSKKYPFVYGAIGIHPWFIQSASQNWEEKMEKLLQNNTFLMIGEIGIDGLKPDIEKQTNIFLSSLNLAKKYNRSVHIHAVKSWNNILPIIKNFSELTFLFHRFNASEEIIQELNKYDAWYSVNSPTNISKLPINRVLTETDSDTETYNYNKFITLVDNFPIHSQQLKENFYQFLKKSGELIHAK